MDEKGSLRIASWVRKLHNSVPYLPKMGEELTPWPECIHLGYSQPERENDKVIYKGVDRCVTIKGLFPEFDPQLGWEYRRKEIIIRFTYNQTPTYATYPYLSTCIDIDENVFAGISEFSDALKECGLSHSDSGVEASRNEDYTWKVDYLTWNFNLGDSTIPSEMERFTKVLSELQKSQISERIAFTLEVIAAKATMTLKGINGLMERVADKSKPLSNDQEL